MTQPFAAHLPHRSIISIGGADRFAFLQGLVSNDVAKVSDTHAVYAALLTPQGKFLHDMFVLVQGDAFLIDCEAARAEDLLRRLAAYKLRAKVTFENLKDSRDVWAVWGGDYKATLAYSDPRLSQLGYRAIVARDELPADVQVVTLADYDALRLSLGVADGNRDMEIEKSTLTEGNFDFLNGVDWKKGCYIGQELTARMHYRGLAKKRLFPVRITGEVPANGVLTFQNAESGQMRSHKGNVGLALLNIDSVHQSIKENTPFACADAQIYPLWPDWMPQKG